MKSIGYILFPIQMVKRNFSLIAVATIISVAVTAAQTSFQFTMSGNGQEEANSIILTQDSGYAIVGRTFVFGSNYDMYVMKINQHGHLEWATSIGGPDNDFGVAIVQTPDGGYLAGARSGSFLGGGSVILLVRLDPEGSVLWQRAIRGFVAGSLSEDGINTMVATDDGGVVISGGTVNLDAGIGGTQLWKLDSTGIVQWNRVHSGSGGRFVIRTSDGGYALGGTWSDDLSMLKLDSLGIIQWTVAVGGVSRESGRGVIQTRDGGYLLFGETISFGSLANMYFAKIDSVGSLEWTRYVGSSGREVARDVVQTANGCYLVAGQTTSYGSEGTFNVYVVRLSSTGEVEWSRSVGTTIWNEFALSIKQTYDGGFITAGYRAGGFGYAMNIVKFDADGQTCGNMTSPVSGNGIGGMVKTPPNPNLNFPGHTGAAVSGQVNSGGAIAPICGITVIPVELTSFTSSATGNEVTLSWVTASEINNSGFEIERAPLNPPQVGTSGQWKKIGFVEGNGTTTETNYYSFEDKNLSAGKYFYRLKQIDFDGTFEYSNVVEIDINIPVEFSLSQNYPNPFNPSTNIIVNVKAKGDYKIDIFNILGERIFNLFDGYLVQGENKFEVNMNNNPSGIYLIKVSNGAEVRTSKIMLMK
jgi:hypothetical protein